MRDLAVVVVNYESREFLAPCLEALPAALNGLSAETWVVDNASTDGSAALVREQFPSVRLIANSSNLGYGRANNQALEAAGFGLEGFASPEAQEGGFRHALLLNPDTVPPPGSLKRLVELLDADPGIGVCGPRVVRPDGSLDRACRRGEPTPSVAFYQLSGLARLFPRSPRFARYNLTYLPEERQADVDAVVGACMLIRGAALRRVGLFDPRFFMYGEDLDLCLRIRRAGWRVVYAPSVSVLHHKGRSTRKATSQMTREFYRSMLLFHDKHFAPRSPALVNFGIHAAVHLGYLLALARQALQTPERRAVGSAGP